MKKKKLLLFHNKLLPYRVDMFNFLAKKFNTKFLFFTKNIEISKRNKYGLIQSKDYVKKLNAKKEFLTKGISIFNKDIFRFGIFKNLKSFNPDIVITYDYSLSTISSIFFKKIFKKTYKIFIMTDDNIYSKKRTGIRYLSQRIVLKFIDGIILANKNIIPHFNKIIKKKCFFLYNPIIHDEKRFRNELIKSKNLSKKNFLKHKLNKKKVILFVGRLSQEKNIDQLLINFSKIKNQSLKLIIIGNGTEYNFLKDLSNKLKCSKRVLFLGKLEVSSLYSWYNIAQIFVLPSTREMWGTVVNEALISGLKVICSNRAGSSILINKSNGLIYNIDKKDNLNQLLQNEIKKINPLSNTKLNKIKKNLMPYNFNKISNKLAYDLNNKKIIT